MGMRYRRARPMTGKEVCWILGIFIGGPMLLLLIFGTSHQQTLKQEKARGELISKGEYKGPWGFERYQKEAHKTCTGWASLQKFNVGPEPWFCADKCDVLKKCDITREHWSQWQQVWSKRLDNVRYLGD